MTEERRKQNRTGRNRICYISDMSTFKSHYPNREISKSIDDIVEELFNPPQ